MPTDSLRLRSLRLRGFRLFSGEHRIEFPGPDGCDLHIVRGPNGSGKSTILNALHLCLYGSIKWAETEERPYVSRKHVDSLSDSDDAEGAVAVTLNDGTNVLTFERAVRTRGQSTSWTNAVGPLTAKDATINEEVVRVETVRDEVLSTSTAHWWLLDGELQGFNPGRFEHIVSAIVDSLDIGGHKDEIRKTLVDHANDHLSALSERTALSIGPHGSIMFVQPDQDVEVAPPATELILSRLSVVLAANDVVTNRTPQIFDCIFGRLDDQIASRVFDHLAEVPQQIILLDVPVSVDRFEINTATVTSVHDLTLETNEERKSVAIEPRYLE